MADVEFLRQVSIFAHLEPERLQHLTSKLRPRRYQRGEVIFHEDDPGDRMHIIVEGSVKISVTSEDGREKNIALFKPGECFGEMALLDGSRRSASATALEALETLVLMRDDFLDFLTGHPQVAADITNLLAQRLRNVKNGVPYVQNLDPYGNLLFANFSRELNIAGIQLIAATSLNLQGESEICDLSGEVGRGSTTNYPTLLLSGVATNFVVEGTAREAVDPRKPTMRP